MAGLVLEHSRLIRRLQVFAADSRASLGAYRRPIMWLCQIPVIALAMAFAFLLRFDFTLPKDQVLLFQQGLLLALLIKLPVYAGFGLERGAWRDASILELLRILLANFLASSLFTFTAMLVVGRSFPRSIYLIDSLLCFFFLAAGRFMVRLYYDISAELASRKGTKKILVYGAGAAGLALAREIRSNPSLKCQIVGFLDDDSQKRRSASFGTPVVGAGRDAARIVQRYRETGRRVDEIVIALPSASHQQLSDALANCRVAGVPCKTIPSLGEIVTGKVRVSEMREVSVEDLLGRDPVRLDEQRILKAVAGRTVMVTGAGGSIGSELCRQLSQFHPKRLVAFEQAESDLFRIEMELKTKFPSVQMIPTIGDIRNYKRVEAVIREYGVESIFHAAAYKHVPMMEDHVPEAVQNNILGVYNVVQAARRNQVQSFVMISSDKAVNPTNVMGATKRVAELVVSSIPACASESGTRFVSVRFGNVLGSNGSVVPLFREQIASGGPVTVTHPDMRRYFMTISEAVQLVLQASVMGKGSEIFVLDMGEPVRILDLARSMIRLSGHEPDVQIPIRFTGLRPGEKLCEELAVPSEQMRPTCHEKITVFCGRRMDYQQIESWIAELHGIMDRNDEIRILFHIRKIVPEYQPSGKWHAALMEKSEPAVALALGA